jgi:hypothetical protein
LSDGPDPQADPVGYAEAQVGPLDQLTIGNRALRNAVHELAAADDAFYLGDGHRHTAALVATAVSDVNSLCPGAAG